MRKQRMWEQRRLPFAPRGLPAVLSSLLALALVLLLAPMAALAEQVSTTTQAVAKALEWTSFGKTPQVEGTVPGLSSGSSVGFYPESLLAALQGPQETGLMGLLSLAALVLFAASAATWIYHKPQTVNRITGPGFEVVSPTEPRHFIPLLEQTHQLDFVANVKTNGDLRLSANLNKVSLSIRRYGYLMEDKNYRNALLVNRRRVRRTLLRDGDVLDLGDMTLLYRDIRDAPFIRRSAVTPPEGKVFIKFNRTRNPVRKGTPVLISEQYPNRQFYISKNLVFIGRSEDNDLVIKSQDVNYKHAKIERVGSRYKIQDLSSTGATYVNNRRVEQRFLKEGDELSIETHRFKYQLVTKPVREHASMLDSQGETASSDNGRANDDGDSDT